LFYCGYVPLVPLFWLRLPLLFFVFSTSMLVLSFSCGGHLKNTTPTHWWRKQRTALRKMTSMVLLKRGKNNGIAVCVPKETILKETAAKFE
jgi:hypothetical protein